jgi:hypothetical protein
MGLELCGLHEVLGGKAIACLLLYEDYVWVSLGNAMKAKQSKAKQRKTTPSYLRPCDVSPINEHETIRGKEVPPALPVPKAMQN